MAVEWTVTLRFEDRDIPSEEEFRATVEDDWQCTVVGDIEEQEV